MTARSLQTAFSGSVWPNGQFGVARLPERDYEPFRKPPLDSFELQCDRWGFLAHGEAYAPYASPIGLSLLARSHRPVKKAVRRGLKGITSYGRKLVRNGCFLLESRYPKKRLSFLTVTFPAMPVEQYRQVVGGFDEIVRQFIQRLRRRLARAGLPGAVVGCVEIQPSRAASSGVPWLHLHLVFLGRHPGRDWACAPCEFREDWRRACSNVVPAIANLDWSASENVQSVRSSAENYLGKYMTKGSREVGQVASDAPELLPKCWYICTSKLRRAVKCRIVRVTNSAASYLVDRIESAPDTFRYVRSVTIAMSDGCPLSVGYHGQMDYDDVSLFSDIVKQQRQALKENWKL